MMFRLMTVGEYSCSGFAFDMLMNGKTAIDELDSSAPAWRQIREMVEVVALGCDFHIPDRTVDVL